MSIRILLADDHTLMRQGLRQILEQRPEFEVIAEASSGLEAVEMVQRHQPDVAIVDIAMKELNGIEATAQILKHSPHTAVLILSMYSDERYVIRAVKAGSWTQSGKQGDRIEAAGVELEPGEYELKLAAADPDSTSALPGNTGLIALDLRVTPELAAEGTARDVVRIVQQARRDAGLAVSDRIRLDIGADGAVADAVRAHAGFLAAETLAVGLEVRPAAEVGGDPHPVALSTAGAVVTVALARVPS